MSCSCRFASWPLYNRDKNSRFKIQRKRFGKTRHLTLRWLCYYLFCLWEKKNKRNEAFSREWTDLSLSKRGNSSALRRGQLLMVVNMEKGTGVTYLPSTSWQAWLSIRILSWSKKPYQFQWTSPEFRIWLLCSAVWQAAPSMSCHVSRDVDTSWIRKQRRGGSCSNMFLTICMGIWPMCKRPSHHHISTVALI